eukprot:CAMPEP_0172296968 /NCGR_PEP_ID=MMETSP1058-20130122/156_1 /TAXON_ID=83371 /ORGANISM="Detonula confervacea, Strain CCMP 353" /LENGTH=119 /DNA_ID=CAMNT_0013006057 /DNA_START=127 /DNA_END=482 /DNA_ORIENTATION=-
MNYVYAALALLTTASNVAAFVPSIQRPFTRVVVAMAEEGTDFDAPVPANPAVASGPLKTLPVVDDECYMGKDLQLDECADFDPPVNPNVKIFRGTADEDTDFDAPIPADPSVSSGPLET